MENDFRIDQWLVQPQLNTIASPDNTTTQLEPKVMEVLVYLAEHAGEVLSKDAIIGAVWPDTFVTDDALAHKIWELRQVFQDDPKEPRVIQTIAKKGYRLIAPVLKLKAPASRYEILHKLGEGATGEVFLAKDTELHRKVALKFVLEQQAGDEASRKLLLREARAAAALDHPFITKIFDTGQIEGKTFIAMEHVEGQTLKQNLTKGRLEMKEALRIASEIAEALESAHDKGIVHRDLKPSNIMITPQGHVKVMDFGLAKLLRAADASLSSQDTMSALTRDGTTAGTLPYMSPEQLRGEDLDQRSDLFSFGTILYEMLSGVHPFQRATPVDTGHAILHEAIPPLGGKIPQCQPLLEHAVAKLLAKDPGKRYQVVHDVRTDLADIGESVGKPATVPEERPLAAVSRRPSHASSPGYRWLVTVAMLAATAIITVLVMIMMAPQPQPAAALAVRSVIKLEPGLKLAALPTRQERDYMSDRPSRQAMTLSSDGTYLAYSAIPVEEAQSDPDAAVHIYRPVAQAPSQLYLRAMNDTAAKPIPGTEGGVCPFFSPDAQWIGFWTEKALNKVPLAGGPPVVICELPGANISGQVFGASWGSNGMIVLAYIQGGLWRVPATGGKPEALTTPDISRGEVSHRLPQILPDDESVIYTVMTNIQSTSCHVELYSLRTGESKTLIEDGADARYVPTGHLVFVRKGTLMGAPFDLDGLRISGAAVPLEMVMQALSYPVLAGANTGSGLFAFSDFGSLVYVPGTVYPDPSHELLWVDRQGKEELVGRFGGYIGSPRISPDGRQIAYWDIDENAVYSVWIYDVNRRNRVKFTPEGNASAPIWTPDGRRLTFASADSTQAIGNMFWQPVDRREPAERLIKSEVRQAPHSWSADGSLLAFTQSTGNQDIYVLRMKDRQSVPVAASPVTELTPDLSPDGRWIAYASRESGDLEVWVQPFPGPGGKHKISTGGGREPVWSPSGKELFYRDPSEKRVMVVEVQTEPSFKASPPGTLFEGAKPYVTGGPQYYDVSPDGKHFLMVRKVVKLQTVTEMILVQNWFEELKHLVPTGK